MKIDQVLNEIQAEIVNGKIPSNKIFSGNNIVNLKSNDKWRSVLGDILVAIKRAGLEKEFSRDSAPDDIIGSDAHNGRVKLISDTGSEYSYDINSKKLFRKKK